jgi:hypothetical protein
MREKARKIQQALVSAGRKEIVVDIYRLDSPELLQLTVHDSLGPLTILLSNVGCGSDQVELLDRDFDPLPPSLCRKNYGKLRFERAVLIAVALLTRHLRRPAAV